jgi:molecular chaperone DnaJ
MFTAPCPSCRGEGRIIKTPCQVCSGSGEQARSKKIVVTFPAGIDDGQTLRVSGQGAPSPTSGGPPGDVLVQVQIEGDPRFERHGVDLVTRVRVPFVDAVLGAKVDVPTLDDEALAIEAPAGMQPGHVVVVRGRGVPRLDGKGRARGSLHVVLEVEVPSPTALSPRARELLEKLRAELAKDARERPPVEKAASAGD